MTVLSRLETFIAVSAGLMPSEREREGSPSLRMGGAEPVNIQMAMGKTKVDSNLKADWRGNL